MGEGQPIYAPDIPPRVSGEVRKVVQLANIPLPIAQTMQDMADRSGKRPDDVAALAILRLQFLGRQEMNGGVVIHRISGEGLLGGEDIDRELDFGFRGPEHQGLRGKVRRFLRRHRLV